MYLTCTTIYTHPRTLKHSSDCDMAWLGSLKCTKICSYSNVYGRGQGERKPILLGMGVLFCLHQQLYCVVESISNINCGKLSEPHTGSLNWKSIRELLGVCVLYVICTWYIKHRHLLHNSSVLLFYQLFFCQPFLQPWCTYKEVIDSITTDSTIGSNNWRALLVGSGQLFSVLFVCNYGSPLNLSTGMLYAQNTCFLILGINQCCWSPSS